MDNNDVDEEDFYKKLEFEHEDEDLSPEEITLLMLLVFPLMTMVMSSASPTALNEVEFSDTDQEPALQWQPEYGFPLRSSSTYHLKRS